jgi:hypothetical protein
MTEPHLNRLALDQKIKALFTYRMFPWLLDQCPFNSSKEKAEFLQQLTDLQTHIYDLDAHLESHWNTCDTTLKRHWAIVKEDLAGFGIAPLKTDAYLSHLRKYEAHELGLRSGQLPQSYGMSYFYFYKSCDVKLLRRLIYEKGDLRSSLGGLDEWRYFDLVTEVNDDVEDVQEDLQFVNGNRFLISLITEGVSATRLQFLEFLDSIARKAYSRFDKGPKGPFREMVLEHTYQQVEATKIAIEKQLQIPVAEIKESARLWRHM